MPKTSEPLNLFYRLVVVAGAVFILTILAMVAVVFGNSNAPVARFLDEYGGLLIAGEVTTTILLALLAMGIDRRRILQNAELAEETTSVSSENAEPSEA